MASKSFIEAALELSREKSQAPGNLSKAYESLGLVCEKLNLYEESVKAYDLMMQYELPQNYFSEDQEEIVNIYQNQYQNY